MTDPNAFFGAGDAYITRDGKYRYWLTRNLGDGEGEVVFLMLNPSTADARLDDATVRRCTGFARREGFAKLVIINLFALRATNPKYLSAKDAVGPYNDLVLAAHFHLNVPIIAAWGAGGPLVRDRWKDVVKMIPKNRELMCLGPPTSDGHPRHPLYLSKHAPMETFCYQGLVAQMVRAAGS